MFAEKVGATNDENNLIIGIPEFSVLKLRALEFKLFLGMDQVTLVFT